MKKTLNIWLICCTFLIGSCVSDTQNEEQQNVDPALLEITEETLESDTHLKNIEAEESIVKKQEETSPAVAHIKDVQSDISESKKKKQPEKSTAPQKKVIKKKPIITFDESVHDFGELAAGDKYEHKFKFKNTGNGDLVIKSAIPSCGCTIPSYPFIPIAPGETGYIGIVYNSVGKSGYQTPDIKVMTNATPSSYTISLSGEVTEKN